MAIDNNVRPLEIALRDYQGQLEAEISNAILALRGKTGEETLDWLSGIVTRMSTIAICFGNRYLRTESWDGSSREAREKKYLSGVIEITRNRIEGTGADKFFFIGEGFTEKITIKLEKWYEEEKKKGG